MDLLNKFRHKKIKPSISEIVIKKYYEKHPSSSVICKAPFSSLYFHPDGEVGACCLNKNVYYYGKYNINSVSEIIKSDNRKKHQDYLKSNNFSLGCQVCENSLVAGNYSGLLAKIYQKFTTSKKIERIDFELSYHCNFDCIMCDRDKSNKKSDIYNDCFIEEIKPLLKKIKFANFLGGEPFIIPIYYQIWNYLIKYNPKCMITVQTNGSIYNEKIEILLKHVNFHVGVSLDSMNPEHFENIRRNSSFVTVIKNIEIFGKAMKAKGSNLQLSTCLLRTNYHDIPEIIQYANKNKYVIFFNQVFTPRQLNIRDLHSLEIKSIITHYKSFVSNLDSSEIHKETNKTAFFDLIKLIELWYEKAVTRERESVYLTHGILIDIISNSNPIKSKDNKDLINKIISELPSRILCTQEQVLEIKNFNYADLLQIDVNDEMAYQVLLNEIKDFFNL